MPTDAALRARAEKAEEALRLAYTFLIHHAAEAVRVTTPDHLCKSGLQRLTADWHEDASRVRGLEIRKSADAISAAMKEE